MIRYKRGILHITVQVSKDPYKTLLDWTSARRTKFKDWASSDLFSESTVT